MDRPLGNNVQQEAQREIQEWVARDGGRLKKLFQFENMNAHLEIVWNHTLSTKQAYKCEKCKTILKHGTSQTCPRISRLQRQDNFVKLRNGETPDNSPRRIL